MSVTYKFECPACFYDKKEEKSGSQRYVIGEVFTCPDCGKDFEIVKIEDNGLENVLKLKDLGETKEDWGE